MTMRANGTPAMTEDESKPQLKNEKSGKAEISSKVKREKLTRKQIEAEIEEWTQKGLSACASSRYWKTRDK